jgi:hypothetical protein
MVAASLSFADDTVPVPVPVDDSSSPETVVEVHAKKNLIQKASTETVTTLDHDQISELPQGETVSLPTLITETTPGVTAGSMNSLLFHGSFGKVQYQIDGVQLPDTPDNAFGEEFSARNIESMSLIMGGFSAEYGDRLSAVVDITTKTGTENPGGLAEVNYGSYNSVAPYALFSGSNKDGDWHYFISAQYNRTDRGLNTPEPASPVNTDVNQGGTDAVHDESNGASAFFKADYQMDNENKFMVILSESYKFYQIPNFPSNFSIKDPIFNNSDIYQNDAYVYTPSTTNDTQTQHNTLVQASWKHTFSEHSFMQVAPFYKYTYTRFDNDPSNDLYSVLGSEAITGATAASLYENRHVNTLGAQADYTNRLGEANSVKMGIRTQAAQAAGSVQITAATTGSSPITTTDDGTNTGYTESAYLQDDVTLAKPLVLNIGVRFDAIQYHFSDSQNTDWMAQPRVGLNYMATEKTKLHAFYGKFFQPAPLEDFHDTFAATASINGYSCPVGQLCPYDIKSEKDDYVEAGVDQQIGTHLVSVKAYFRWSQDELDDSQLLNTNLLQPINYGHGRNYGVDISAYGKIDAHWSDYFNYSYSIARVRGISGGIFTVAPDDFPSGSYVPLDEEQIHTATAGLTYTSKHFWWSVFRFRATSVRIPRWVTISRAIAGCRRPSFPSMC